MGRQAPPHPAVRERDPPPHRRVRSQGDKRDRRDLLHACRDLVLGFRTRPHDRAAHSTRPRVEADEGTADLPGDRPSARRVYARQVPDGRRRRSRALGGLLRRRPPLLVARRRLRQPCRDHPGDRAPRRCAPRRGSRSPPVAPRRCPRPARTRGRPDGPELRRQPARDGALGRPLAARDTRLRLRRRRPVRCLRRHPRHSGHVRRCDADRRARARPRASDLTGAAHPQQVARFDAAVEISGTLPRSRSYGSASGSSVGRAVVRDLRERRESTLEQAALRRIATLVAQGVQPHELFAVVAEEVGRVVDAPSVAVARYESDDTATVCGTFASQEPLLSTRTRVSGDGASVLGVVREHAERARVDDYPELEGEIADAIRRNGMCSSVGVPIVVAGRLWGAIVTSGTERLPEDTGARLAEFTELVAAAIANTEAREALARLADEQAALRRVATLVALRAPTDELFGALVEEVALPVGRRWVPEGENVTALVFRTGAAARIDDFSKVSGPLGKRARPVGYRSAVGCPIMVEGRLWGVIATA